MNKKELKNSVAAVLLLIAMASVLTMYSYIRNTCLSEPMPSIKAGIYHDPIEVGFLNTDGDIYYTIDGTEPDENATKYKPDTTIYMTKTMTLKSVRIDNNGYKSPVRTDQYIVSRFR